jgi:hypothetical protein
MRSGWSSRSFSSASPTGSAGSRGRGVAARDHQVLGRAPSTGPRCHGDGPRSHYPALDPSVTTAAGRPAPDRPPASPSHGHAPTHQRDHECGPRGPGTGKSRRKTPFSHSTRFDLPGSQFLNWGINYFHVISEDVTRQESFPVKTICSNIN